MFLEVNCDISGRDFARDNFFRSMGFAIVEQWRKIVFWGFWQIAFS
jgi:hypothetical protein